jgi:hypothetical protein
MNMQMAMMQSANEGFDLGEKQRYNTAPGGFDQVHDHANQENAKCTDENCEYQIRGRQICLGECKFVFERVWKVTCANHKKDAAGEECAHDERFEQEILISDLFHIIDLAGQFMNKKAPDDNDTRPYDEFMRYAKLHSVADEKTGEKHAYQYVSAEDVPKILLGTFVGQSDEKRKEVEEALEHHKKNNETKHIIEHIVDTVW